MRRRTRRCAPRGQGVTGGGAIGESDRRREALKARIAAALGLGRWRGWWFWDQGATAILGVPFIGRGRHWSGAATWRSWRRLRRRGRNRPRGRGCRGVVAEWSWASCAHVRRTRGGWRRTMAKFARELPRRLRAARWRRRPGGDEDVGPTRQRGKARTRARRAGASARLGRKRATRGKRELGRRDSARSQG